jgi:hypothetical protein
MGGIIVPHEGQVGKLHERVAVDFDRAEPGLEGAHRRDCNPAQRNIVRRADHHDPRDVAAGAAQQRKRFPGSCPGIDIPRMRSDQRFGAMREKAGTGQQTVDILPQPRRIRGIKQASYCRRPDPCGTHR